MRGEAIKFTDLDAFQSFMEGEGFGQQARAIIYEHGKLPYCSAYLIPVDRLPPAFDLSKSDRFGGTLTEVEPIKYQGTERFYTDFMIYPQSLSGFVEVEEISSFNFADDQTDAETMIYVINLEDGGGQEFFLTVEGNLVNLSAFSEEQPQEFKAYKLVAKKIDQIREKYPASCQIYGLEQSEFDARRSLLLAKSPEAQTAAD